MPDLELTVEQAGEAAGSLPGLSLLDSAVFPPVADQQGGGGN